MSNKNQSVLEHLREAFGGDELAPDVFLKYALRNHQGDLLETDPGQLHTRLAKEFARIEAKYPNPLSKERILSLLTGFAQVVPQGSPMSGIGNPHQLQSLSNCFVIDQPHDSYGGILFSDQEQVQIMKRRGGVGFDISTIRPKGQPTTNAARTTDGIGVFMERFSNSTREVAQGGRRGALMLTIHCSHPELETFIDIKRDLKKVTGANISIRFTDEFMQAAEKGEDFTLRWPVEAAPEDAEITRVVNARQVWEKFIDAAWTSAEPGALFWDTVVNEGIVDCYRGVGYKTISTNPCITGDTVVQTNAGPKTVKELADNNAQFMVYAYDTDENKVVQKTATAFKTKEDAKILQLTTKSGKSIKLTPDHRVFTQREWIEAGDLQLSDKILKINTEWDEIQDISVVKNEDVYDLTVDDVHNFFANDILVHNCGEIPLSPYDSCRLMVINLTSFIQNPFTPNASFNFGEFEAVVQDAQRLMDDLVDLEVECVDHILEKIKNDPQPKHVKQIEQDLWEKIRAAGSNGRRTGLGITGLGDALAALGLRYGSEESIAVTEEIYKSLATWSHYSSLVMAHERGAFPVWDWEKEKGHSYLGKIMQAVETESPGALEMWRTSGRRNIALTTTAPVGSVSILTQTTSGIEPAFLLSYKRRRKITQGDITSRVDFVDPMGDKWQEYTVYHHWFKKWMDVTGKSDPQESPYWGATANDIDWVNSVKIQAAAQRWVDHSISKTCVSGDSLVETDSGMLYADEIAELSNCQPESSATVSDLMTVNHHGRPAMIGFVSDQGVKPVYRVTTKSGLSIKTTLDHKFILLNDDDGLEAWAELKDINVGDRIKLS